MTRIQNFFMKDLPLTETSVRPIVVLKVLEILSFSSYILDDFTHITLLFTSRRISIDIASIIMKSLALFKTLNKLPPWSRSCVEYDLTLIPSSGNIFAMIVVTELGRKARILVKHNARNILHNLI